jgi:hypothetical protein
VIFSRVFKVRPYREHVTVPWFALIPASEYMFQHLTPCRTDCRIAACCHKALDIPCQESINPYSGSWTCQGKRNGYQGAAVVVAVTAFTDSSNTIIPFGVVVEACFMRVPSLYTSTDSSADDPSDFRMDTTTGPSVVDNW